MSNLLSGARFELGALRQLPATLLILAGAAIFYSFIYPAPYSPQTYREMPVYALDRDNSTLSRRLLSHIDASELLRIVAGSGNPNAAQLALKKGEVLGYIEIPAGLERDVTRGNSPSVGLFANAGYLLAYSQLAGAATEVVLEAGAEIGATVAVERSGNPAAAASQMPFNLETVELYDPAGGYASFVVPAVVMVILQQTMFIGLGLLCEARRNQMANGPPGRLLPCALWTLGRNLPWVGLYLLQFLIIRWIIFPVYHLPAIGPMAYLVPFVCLFFLSASLLGLLIAELFHRSEDVIPFLLFTSLPVVFLSGFSWPMEVIPTPLQWLAYLIPSTPGVEGFVRLNQLGVDLPGAALPIGNLLLQCLLYGGILVSVTRRKTG